MNSSTPGLPVHHQLPEITQTHILRLGDTKECVSNLEGRLIEITQSEKQKEKQTFKNENSLRDLTDNLMHTNTHVIGIPERQKIENGIQSIFDKIMAENLLNMKKETGMQVQEYRQTQTR